MSVRSTYVTRVPRLSNLELADYAVVGLSRDMPGYSSADRLLSALMTPGQVEGSIVEYKSDPSLHEEKYAQVREIYRRITAAGLAHYGDAILPEGYVRTNGEAQS